VGSERLALPAPYDLAWMTWYLSAHAVAGAERYENGRYACAVRTPDGPDVVVLDFDSRTGEVVVTSERSGRPAPELLMRVRSLLDLDTDAAAVAEHLAQDPALAPAVGAAPGVRVPGALDGWDLLLRTMVGQQISLAAARTHLARLVAALGEPLEGTEDYLAAEVVYAVSHEGARHLDDVLTRRTRISIETFDRGTASARPAAALMAGVLGWDDSRVDEEVDHYLRRVEAERQSQQKPTDQEADEARVRAPEGPWAV